MRTALTLLLLFFAPLASAQLVDTEVWVGRVEWQEGKIVIRDLQNVSKQHPGYDNQPAFLADGKSLLYTKEATSLDESGHGVHAVRVDLATGKATPLPEARGFSPTPVADGLMVLRDGRVFLHDASGKEVRAVTETKDAGYFHRLDDKTWVLFLNNQERPIVLYENGAIETMIQGAITAPYRVPGARAVTFVVMEEDARVLKRLDVDAKKVTTLATIPFPTGGQHVWTPRNTLLIASGHTIYEWSPSAPDDWTPVSVTNDPELQGITRIALSPKGDRIALVSTARSETMIRNARSASNRAIEAHDALRFKGFFAKDAKVVTSAGEELVGADAIENALTKQFAERKDLQYVRTPNSIEVRTDIAEERGTWTGWWTEGEEKVEVRGTYTATWQRTISGSGTPSWSIASERFVRESFRKE